MTGGCSQLVVVVEIVIVLVGASSSIVLSKGILKYQVGLASMLFTIPIILLGGQHALIYLSLYHGSVMYEYQ